MFKSGFICLTGRPNVGKSTLMNAIVDAEVAITSSKPETTRKAIRAIRTSDSSQMIFVDTPGIHRPRTLLGKRLNEMVNEQITIVDLILFLTPADEKIGKGDMHIIKHIEQVSAKRTPVFAVISKADKVSNDKLIEKVVEVKDLFEFDEIIPVSSKTDDNIDHLIRVIEEKLPEGELLYFDGEVTDESRYDQISEVVRGCFLENLNDELPHSLAVTINEIVEDENGTEIFVNVFVERDSQKGIILGKGGERIRKVRLAAQRIVRQMISSPEAKLNLQVKIAKNWQSDPKQLQKLGF